MNALRPRMMSVAYRMLRSLADAQDAVQDAFVRHEAVGGVSSPEAFLIRTTTHLCLDRLRARRRRREYVGPWVPEPVENGGSTLPGYSGEPVSKSRRKSRQP